MKHKVTANIIVPVEAVFEDDGIHFLPNQAIDALETEAEWRCCLRDGEFTLADIETKPLA